MIKLLLSRKFLTSVVSFVNIEGKLISEDCGLISREASNVPYDVSVTTLFPDFRPRFGDRDIFGFSIDAALHRPSI